jgi:muramidase (phage lysozyme)
MPSHRQDLIKQIYSGESGGRYDIRNGGESFDPNGPHPGRAPGKGGTSSASGAGQFINDTWNNVTNGAPMTKGYQDAATWKLATQDYNKRTGRDLDADLQEKGVTPEIKSALAPTWTSFYGKGNAPQMQTEGGKGRDASGKMPTNVNTGKPFEGAGDFLTSKQFILPALQGLGAMAASPSRYVGSAILQGVGAGAKAYQNFECQQANVAQTKATTGGINMDTLRKSIQQIPGYGSASWVIDPETGKLKLVPVGVALNDPNVQFASSNAVNNEQLKKSIEDFKAQHATVKAAEPVKAANIDVDPYKLINFGDVSKSFAEQDIKNAAINPDAHRLEAEQQYKTIKDQAAAASRLTPYLKDVGDILNKANKGQNINTTGYGYDTIANITTVLNKIKSTFGVRSEDLTPADLMQQSEKLQNLLGGLRTSGLSQNSLSALNQFVSTVPNPKMEPKAAAELWSELMRDNIETLDNRNHADKYYTTTSSRGLTSMRNQDRSFQAEPGYQPGDYSRHKQELSKLILAPLFEENKNKPSGWDLMRSNKIGHSQAQKELQQKGYDPSLIKYIYGYPGK